MKELIFTGSAVAIVTPFFPDGGINFPKLGELIDLQIAGKTDAIVICGTTGECATLSPTEHAECIRFAVRHTAGRIPVIAGTGSNDTAFATQLSIDAQREGADALLMVTPYYNKTSQTGLIRHFTAVADRVERPIILYNVPSRTGVNIQPETYRSLAEHKNIVATKEASGDISAIAKTIALCGENLAVYSGNDDQITAIMALGGKGVISVLANILPEVTHEISSLALSGKIKESAALQLQYLELCNTLFCDVNPIPVKAALNFLGQNVGECRLPLCELSEKNNSLVETCLKQYHL